MRAAEAAHQWTVDIRPRRLTCNVLSEYDGIRFVVDMDGQAWTWMDFSCGLGHSGSYLGVLDLDWTWTWTGSDWSWGRQTGPLGLGLGHRI